MVSIGPAGAEGAAKVEARRGGVVAAGFVDALRRATDAESSRASSSLGKAADRDLLAEANANDAAQAEGREPVAERGARGEGAAAPAAASAPRSRRSAEPVGKAEPGTSSPPTRATASAPTPAAGSGPVEARAEPSPTATTAPAAATAAPVSPVAATPTPQPPVTAAVSRPTPALAAPTISTIRARASTATVAAPRPSPPDPARFGAELQRSIESSLRVRQEGDHWQLKIELAPPELGPVRVQLELREGVLHGTIDVESPELHERLDELLQDLEQRLRDQGHDAHLRRARDPEEGGEQGVESGEDAPASELPEGALESDHLLDLLA